MFKRIAGYLTLFTAALALGVGMSVMAPKQAAADFCDTITGFCPVYTSSCPAQSQCPGEPCYTKYDSRLVVQGTCCGSVIGYICID